jgi:copper(I)-binding protein
MVRPTTHPIEMKVKAFHLTKDMSMRPILQLFAHAVFAVALAAPALAEEVKAGDLVITQAWSRATPGGAKVAGGYLTIQNKGSAAARRMSPIKSRSTRWLQPTA